MSNGAVEPANLSEVPEIKAADFPANFVWGSATAAYQIEGAVREDGRGQSIWDTFSHTPGKIENGENGDVANDHYHLWPDDVKLMQNLNLNGYRFSIAWSRIFPQGKGEVNQKGLDFYDRLIDTLLAANIQPFVTLYHWDLPQALQDKGGWANRDTANYFAEYAELIARKFGDRVKNWITHNEPFVATMMGNYMGVHAPGLHDLRTALQVSYNLLLSHGMAVPRLREYSPNCQAGITLVLNPAYPATNSSDDAEAARRFDGFFNRWFLDPVFGKGFPADMVELYGEAAPEMQSADLQTMGVPLDFLGVNYYSRAVIKAASTKEGGIGAEQVKVAGAQRTAMDWEVYPAALTEMLVRVKNEYNPAKIYITENGAAYEDRVENGRVHDVERLNYLKHHFAAVKAALDRGVPMAGYFAWSLMDNFEWSYGYGKRFGLTYVDYQTQQRIIKDSGLWYANFIQQ